MSPANRPAPPTPEPVSVRTALGSWLEGPRSVLPDDATYRGERLGLPPDGPGSLAGVGHRLLAFAIDWLMCASIAWGFWRDTAWATPVFALEVLVLTYFAGGSAGQLVLRLRVVGLHGRLTGGRVLLRTVLLCALIPALVWDRDGRGLHDKAAGTVLLSYRNSSVRE